MTVSVVTYSHYDDWALIDVYASHALARTAIDALPISVRFDTEEWGPDKWVARLVYQVDPETDYAFEHYIGSFATEAEAQAAVVAFNRFDVFDITACEVQT